MRLIDADVLKNIIKEEASSLVLCDESACEIDLFELKSQRLLRYGMRVTKALVK